MSIDKALAIVEKYPTPSLLLLAYAKKIGSNGENMLSAIPFGKLNKKIGPVLSETVYQLYTKEKF